MQNNTYASLLDQEEEARANYHVIRAIAVAEVFLLLCFVLNELGVFEAEKILMRMSFFTSLLLFAICLIGAKKRNVLSDKRFKFVLCTLTLLLTFSITVLLPGYTSILYMLPLLIAAQYRSRRLAYVSMTFSCLFAFFSPVIAYLLGTYSTDYLSGYLETVARVTVTLSETPAFTETQSVLRILLYLGLPQVLILAALYSLFISIVKNRKENHLRRMEVADLNSKLTKQLQLTSDVQDSALIAMAQLIESRDQSTGGHVRRTALIVQEICRSMLRDPASGMTEELAAQMVKAAPLHDLGKIAIDDDILRKPGPLTPEEWVLVKKHPTDSARSIEQVFRGMEDADLTRVAVNMAFYHHERLDGSGYPKGLTGRDIPLEARIMAVADVLDAVLSRRSYKAPVPFETALSIVKEEMLACRLDPILLPYLLEVKEAIRKNYI